MERRIFSIDCTRGLMAFAVMVYHYIIWTFWMPESREILGRAGIYSVPVFYIISGLALYIIYHQKFRLNDLKVYGLKRFFRIYPLLLVASISWLLAAHEHYDGRTLWLNFTGLFGFIDPGAYVGRVAWSVGNELVFYTLFPVFMLALRLNKLIWWSLVFASMVAGCYFAFSVLDPAIRLEDQWTNYINPFNHLMFFASGIAIGYVTKMTAGSSILKSLSWPLIIASVSFFIFYPTDGNLIALVTGQNRVLFSVASVLLCAGVYWTEVTPPPLFRPLLLLGAASYSLYMLHPVVYFLLKIIAGSYYNLHSILFCIAAILLTIAISYFSFIFIEKPMINLGRTIADRVTDGR